MSVHQPVCCLFQLAIGRQHSMCHLYDLMSYWLAFKRLGCFPAMVSVERGNISIYDSIELFFFFLQTVGGEHKKGPIGSINCHSPTQPQLKFGLDKVMGWPTTLYKSNFV